MTDFSFSLQDSELRFNFTEFVPTLIQVERGADSDWVLSVANPQVDSDWVIRTTQQFGKVDSDFVQDTLDSEIDFLYERTLEATDFNDFQTTVRKLRASRYTYAFMASAPIVDESDSFTITCYVLGGAPDGLVVPYNITGVTSADIGGASLTGFFTLNNDSDTITFNTTRDATDSEIFTLTLDHYHQNVAVNVIIEDNPPDLVSGTQTFFPMSQTATDPTSSSWRSNNVGYTFTPNVGITTATPMTNAYRMFDNNTTFNDPGVATWDMSNVTNVNQMFNVATNFDQDISGWDVSSVTDMDSMLRNADAFNQDISGWNVDNVTNARRFSFEADQREDIDGDWTEEQHPSNTLLGNFYNLTL